MPDAKSPRIRDEISDKIIAIAEHIATTEGAHQVNVRRITQELGASNRVFYNRFANCDEVLRIVYENAVIQMRESVKPNYHDRESFVEFCLTTGVNVLLRTYDVKMQFSRYMFEHDALTENNRQWWAEGIKTHYAYAREQGWAADVDPDALTYAIWCFCRGYSVDAVTRRLPREDAIRYFRFGFNCFLRGVMKEPLSDADDRNNLTNNNSGE